MEKGIINPRPEIFDGTRITDAGGINVWRSTRCNPQARRQFRRSFHTRRAPLVRSQSMQLVRICIVIAEFASDLALAGRTYRSQKPLRETSSISQIHAAGQIPRCFAMTPHLTSTTSRSRRRRPSLRSKRDAHGNVGYRGAGGARSLGTVVRRSPTPCQALKAAFTGRAVVCAWRRRVGDFLGVRRSAREPRKTFPPGTGSPRRPSAADVGWGIDRMQWRSARAGASRPGWEPVDHSNRRSDDNVG